jgi:hypothetical protein
MANLLMGLAEGAAAIAADTQRRRRPALSAKKERQELRYRKRSLALVLAMLRLAPSAKFPVQSREDRAKPKRGRPLEKKALFARLMMQRSTGELLARDLLPVKATELMALALYGGIVKSTDGTEDEMRREWRRLASAHAPSDPQALAKQVRERQKLEQEIADLKAKRKRNKSLIQELKREAASFQTVSDYLDGRTSGPPRAMRSMNSIAGEGFLAMIDRITERFK